MNRLLLITFFSTIFMSTTNAQPAGILIGSGKPAAPFYGQYNLTVFTETGGIVGLVNATSYIYIYGLTPAQVSFPKPMYLFSAETHEHRYMEPQTIAMGSDGKLMIIYSGAFGLQRLNADGTFDTSFNHGSSLKIYSPGEVSPSYKIAILPNGEFISPIGGRNALGSYLNFIRFSSHGDALSNSLVQVGDYKYFTFTDLVIGEDGKILVGGSVYGEGTTAAGIFVARLNPDGTPDKTFGNGGVVVSKEAYAVKSLSGSTNGKVVVVIDGNRLLRFNNIGMVDATFGSGGSLSLPFQVNETVMQSDGKIIVGGTENSDFKIARLDDTGNFDQTFGISGIATKGFYVRASGPYVPSYDAVTDMRIIGNRLYAYGTADLAVYSLGGENTSNTSSHLAYGAATNTGSQAYGGSLGMEFTVNSPGGILIKQLGAFDHQGDGIKGNIRVAIFNQTTKQIVPGLDAIITGDADGYVNNYRVKNISTVTLMPGTYMLVSQGYNADELNGNPDLGTPIIPGDNGNGAITYTKSFFGPEGSFTLPETWDGPAAGKYVAGTFQFEVLSPNTANAHLAYKAATNMGSQAYGGSLGMEFTVNNPIGIQIKQLGAFDHQGDGIKGNIRVAIFNTTTKQIIPGLDVAITGEADEYSGNYRLKNISPVTLTPGKYVLVAQGYNANELNGNPDLGTPIVPGDSSNGAIGYTRSFFGPEGMFGYPETWDGPASNKYVAGTFQYEIVAASSSTSYLAYKAGTSTGSQAFSGTLGMEFTVNNPAGITIKQLGAFDHLGDGIQGTIRVAIFNTTTKQIVPGLDGTINGLADSYVGNYRVKNISPVILLPGTYRVVSQGYNGQDLNGNPDLGTPIIAGDNGNGAISYTRSYFSSEENFNYPETWDGPAANKYVAGTFQFSINATYPSSSHLAYRAATLVGSQAFGGTLGMEFTVKAPGGIVIRQLGAFDDRADALPGDGIPQGLTANLMFVSIFNKATKTVVPGLNTFIQGKGDEYVYNYRMKNITPVTLPPGTYVIATCGYSAEERNGNVDFGTPIIPGDDGGGAITYNRSLLNTTIGTIKYPEVEDAGPANKYVAGTFRYEVAPNAARYAATETSLVSLLHTETAKSIALKGFPNPTKGTLSLQITSSTGGTASVEVVDVQGAVLQKRSILLPGQNRLSSFTFDLLTQPVGLYLLRVRSADGVQVFKVNVQR